MEFPGMELFYIYIFIKKKVLYKHKLILHLGIGMTFMSVMMMML